MKPLIFALLFLFPAVLCFGLASKFAGEESTFAESAESVRGTVKAIHEKVRSNGRDTEDITTVEVAYTTKENAALSSEAEVGYAVGLSPGKDVEVLYKKAEPRVIQIRAGFFNRSSKVVFFTIFGAFWAVIGLALVLFLSWAKAAAGDPAAKDRIEQMKQKLKDEQAARENRSQ